MITYIEKGEGLHKILKAAGFKVWLEDRQVKFFPLDKEAEIQNIINSYDPVPRSKTLAKVRVVEQINKATSALLDKYPQVERDRFQEQETEARAFVLDTGAKTPLIDEIATRRGVSRAVVANKILTKAEARRLSDKKHLAERQRLSDLIDAGTTYKTIDSINFDPSEI